MQSFSYISCLKIHGVPLLPPIMTDNVKAEMNFYKKLAIAVEKRQRHLHDMNKENTVKHCTDNSTKCEHMGSRNKCILEKRNMSSDSDNESTKTGTTIDTTSLQTSEISSRVKEDVMSFVDMERPNACKLKPVVLEKSYSRMPLATNNNLDPNDKCPFGIIDSRSEPAINGIDLRQCLSDSILKKSCNSESMSQVWEPDVPLDIVPIIQDVPAHKQALKIHSTHSVPKLVRERSYVLETPSPMLLAHLRTKLVNKDNIPSENYIPTSTSIVRRNEWKITQGKIEWENQIEDKECIVKDACKESTVRDDLLGRVSHVPTTRQSADKSCTETLINTNRLTQLANDTQQMPVQEHANKENDNESEFCSHRQNDKVNLENAHAVLTWHAKKNVPMINLTKKTSTSLENTNTEIHHSNQIKEGAHKNLSKNDMNKEPLKNHNMQNSPRELPSSLLLTKLMFILKQIQEVHKEQIHQLAVFQQKAQMVLQKEFEKQQRILLGHIKKSLSAIPFAGTLEIFPSVLFTTTVHCNGESQGINTKSVLNSDNMNDSNGQCELKKSEVIPLSNDEIEERACRPNYILPNNKQRLDSGDGKSCMDMRTCSGGIKLATQRCLSDERDCNNRNCNEELKSNNELNEGLNVSQESFLPNYNVGNESTFNHLGYTEKHVHAASVINAYAKGYLVRRLMTTERVIALKKIYKEALQCMLRLHIDAPLNLSELNFLHRLQLQCDAASMNIVDLFALPAAQRMQIIAHDREIRIFRSERPSSRRSHSFATQKTLARKRLREVGNCQSVMYQSYLSRSRCQTWSSAATEKPILQRKLYESIRRSTSAGAVRKPWR